MAATKMKRQENALAVESLQALAVQMLGKQTNFISSTPSGSFLFNRSGKATLTVPKTKTNALDSIKNLAMKQNTSFIVYVSKSPKSGKMYFVDAKGNVYEMAIPKNVKKSVPKRTR